MGPEHHDTIMEDKHEVTVPMDGRLHDTMVGELEYGDTKAGWIREAIRQRLEREGVELPEELDDTDAETDGGQTVLCD